VRELLHRFDGQEVDGDLLGLFSEGQIRLPVFRQVAPYRSGDGQVEVDALAEACTEPGRSSEEQWVVEIKWRGRQAGVKELQKLLRAAETLSARPWFISRAGFTPKAEAFARREVIMISGRVEIERLAEIVRRA